MPGQAQSSREPSLERTFLEFRSQPLCYVYRFSLPV
jgi:hypothetical protein